MRKRLELLVRGGGRAGTAFAVTFVAWLALSLTDSLTFLRIVFGLGAFVTGGWLALRLVRWAAEKMVWRLRHRLIVTYMFIAVAPVVLLLIIATAAAYSLMLQVALNVVTTELDHRQLELAGAAQAVAELPAGVRAHDMARVVDPYLTDRYEGLAAVLRQNGSITAFPASAVVPPSIVGFDTSRGILHRNGQFFLWAYRKIQNGDVTIVAPISRKLLDQIAPELGVVDLARDVVIEEARQGSGHGLPPSTGRWDVPLFWFTQLPYAEWDRPAEPSFNLGVALETRMSRVVAAVFSRKADLGQGLVQVVLIGGIIVFVLVEVVCWVVGVSMTRTITGTVHHLYEGTQRVMEGQFSHRMAVAGRDQLAEVGASFNRMTANLEQLVSVAKEKERLHSELTIAQEVQAHLYPKLAERSSHLSVAAVFRPARLVSGDYFDYESACDGQVALAIGDVAGKGISAALLMASLQSSLRTQLGHNEAQSTAAIVARLNKHLCASTTADKYATFFLGLYDERTSALTYTNAGHLQPVLIRKGAVQRLEVTGTIVGAFPGIAYGQETIGLESGDLLALFTDGLSEPESEFGEMFGEDRLVEILLKNAHRPEPQILDAVLQAVRQWTASDELQDDITLLLARRL